jgi:hypothetical protein
VLVPIATCESSSPIAAHRSARRRRRRSTSHFSFRRSFHAHADASYMAEPPPRSSAQGSTHLAEGTDTVTVDAEVGHSRQPHSWFKVQPWQQTLLLCRGTGQRYRGLTQTTASDQIELPQSLVLPNQVLDAGSRAYELGLLEQVTSSEDWGVSSGVPQGVTVALENGWLPLTATNWRINSVGWIATGSTPSEESPLWPGLHWHHRQRWHHISGGGRDDARLPTGAWPRLHVCCL